MLPDYGLPGAAWTRSVLEPETAHLNTPVGQNTYYGSSNDDYAHGSRQAVSVRIEHDLAPPWTLSRRKA